MFGNAKCSCIWPCISNRMYQIEMFLISSYRPRSCSKASWNARNFSRDCNRQNRSCLLRASSAEICNELNRYLLIAAIVNLNMQDDGMTNRMLVHGGENISFPYHTATFFFAKGDTTISCAL